MPLTLADADVAAVVTAQRLCFVATVTPEGRPNLSPKGSIRILDDHRLYFLDLASPGTVRNLRANPWIELNIVDPISRRGYRFRGRGSVHEGDDVHAAALARISADEGAPYHADRVVVIDVDEILPIWSPGYDKTPEELAMRAMWKDRRSDLDAKFEQHLERDGHFTAPGAS